MAQPSFQSPTVQAEAIAEAMQRPDAGREAAACRREQARLDRQARQPLRLGAAIGVIVATVVALLCLFQFGRDVLSYLVWIQLAGAGSGALAGAWTGRRRRIVSAVDTGEGA